MAAALAAWPFFPQVHFLKSKLDRSWASLPFFKNELYFLSQIAYNAMNYLHIFILEAVLLNQKNENNSN